MVTLSVMRGLAQAAARDPAFREFAQSFSSWQDLMSWARAHFVYREEDQEVVRDPRFMLSDMGRKDGRRLVGLEGDCDDIATFLAAVLKVMSYRTRLLAIRTSADTTEFEHVVAQAFDVGDWVTLDPTVSPGTVMTALDELVEMV